MSSEITGREIELRRNVPYPEVPDSKRVGLDKVTDILVYQGKVSEEQMRLARETQKNNPRQDLGKILLSLGFISGADLAQAQAQRLGLDFVELTERDFDRDVVTLVPERILRKHGAIPLRISRSRHLVVAMSDPSNLYALEDLRIISGYQITPVLPKPIGTVGSVPGDTSCPDPSTQAATTYPGADPSLFGGPVGTFVNMGDTTGEPQGTTCACWVYAKGGTDSVAGIELLPGSKATKRESVVFHFQSNTSFFDTPPPTSFALRSWRELYE